MITIWKVEFTPDDVALLRLPQGAQILTVQEQFGKFVAWAQVDTSKPLRLHQLYCYVTGEHREKFEGRYLCTVQGNGGHYVVHFYLGFELRGDS